MKKRKYNYKSRNFFKNFIEERIMKTENFSHVGKTISIFLGFLLSLTAVTGVSAAEDMSSVEQIDYIKSVVDRYVDNKENMTDERVKTSIRKEVGEKLILKPTQRMLDANLKALNEQARQIVAKKNTIDLDAVKAKLQREAEAQYTMYKLRDQVSVRVKRRNIISNIRGIYYRITQENVLIGNTTVLLRDLDELTRSKFDKELNQYLKNQYVMKGIAEIQRGQMDEQQQVFRQLLAAQNRANEKNGYVYVDRENRWVTAEQILNNYLREQERIYRENKAKEARLLAEKRKKEAELAQQRAEEQRQYENETAKAQAAAAAQNETDGEMKKSRRRTPEGAAMDMFAGGESAEIPQDTGGSFIAMSPQDLAEAMRKRLVNEDAYKKLLERVDAQNREIGEYYWGIDADQGYKKALWGFSETDVYYALSKEKEIAFLTTTTLNRHDIIFPEKSRPARIYLYYFFGKLNELRIIMGSLKEREFKIFTDSLSAKYGNSDTQNKFGKDDIFHQIRRGALTQDRLPVILPEAEQKTYTEQGAAQDARRQDKSFFVAAGSSAVPFVIVWEGKISRGVLTFNYDAASGMYSNVVFHKKCFPERLEADRKKRAEAAKKAAEAKNKTTGADKKATTPTKK